MYRFFALSSLVCEALLGGSGFINNRTQGQERTCFKFFDFFYESLCLCLNTMAFFRPGEKMKHILWP
jgi:hypothetical protein